MQFLFLIADSDTFYSEIVRKFLLSLGAAIFSCRVTTRKRLKLESSQLLDFAGYEQA